MGDGEVWLVNPRQESRLILVVEFPGCNLAFRLGRNDQPCLSSRCLDCSLLITEPIGGGEMLCGCEVAVDSGWSKEALIEHRLNSGGDVTDSPWIESVLGGASSTSNCADQIIDDLSELAILPLLAGGVCILSQSTCHPPLILETLRAVYYHQLPRPRLESISELGNLRSRNSGELLQNLLTTGDKIFLLIDTDLCIYSHNRSAKLKLQIVCFGYCGIREKEQGKKMLSRSSYFPRNGGFKPENLGQNALAMIRNLCFSLFVIGVLIFTIIAATYEPEDPLFHPSTKITTFLTSESNATFKSDIAVVKTGEDFVSSNQTAFATFINVTDVESASLSEVGDPDIVSETTVCRVNDPIDCRDPDVFHLMMRSAIEYFKDIHFYRFGKPVPGNFENSCHMAWRFRPKEGKAAAFYKDYRSFILQRSDNCSLSVAKIGDYHSGGNARKRKSKGKNVEKDKEGFEKVPAKVEANPIALPEVGETVNDALPEVESEGSFSRGKYLIYSGGGDRCKSMQQYLWSFMCMLGEAQYLNRTLIMDLSLCLSKIYSSSGQDEEGKDFRFYFDFEHLMDSTSVLDQAQFWMDWNKWQQKDGLNLHLVEDFKTTPMKLSAVKDTLIMRKFGSVEPDNYWYRVCEGEAESVIQRPWHMIWKSSRLLDVASAIASRMNWDFDSVHVERGEKASNKELWPNVDRDTSPEALLASLPDKIEDGRNLYIATNEPVTSFFDPLKDKYSIHFLDEYKDLWDQNSDWYEEMTKLNKGNPVEFDGYMRVSVDTEVFLRGKIQIETFNDLTKDCKDGINTCTSAS